MKQEVYMNRELSWLKFNIIYNKNSPTSAGSEMNCRSEHKCSKEFYKQKKKTLVRVLELYYNNKKRTYCSKNDD